MHKLEEPPPKVPLNKKTVHFFILSVVLLFSLWAPLTGRANEIEVLEHSWETTEKWEKINKTRYAWKATIRSHAREQQKVFIYYYLLDQGGKPVAMNTVMKIIQPDETLEVIGDSYVENHRLPFIKKSQVKVKTRRFP